MTTNRWLSPAPSTRVQVERVMILSFGPTVTSKSWMLLALAVEMIWLTTAPSA